MKNRRFIENAFFDRLLEILKTEKQTWWAQKTNTSQSMVSNYWYKRKHPRGDTIARILELKGISANWLYFNMGPKNLAHLDDSEVEIKQNVDRRTQVEIIELTEENIRLKEQVAKYEVALKQRKLISDGDSAGDDILTDNLIGAFSFIRAVMDILLKMADKYAEDNIDNDQLSAILDWIIQNRGDRNNATAEMLKNLNSIIK